MSDEEQKKMQRNYWIVIGVIAIAVTSFYVYGQYKSANL